MIDFGSHPSTRLCVVGNLNRDVKALGVPASAGILADGETTIAGVAETIGGGGANSACVAAALGATVRFVGKTGDDALGTQLGLALQRRGVDARLARDDRHPTGTTVALGFNTGQRHFLSALPNNRSLEFGDLDLSALDECDHLLRADVWFSPAMLEGGNRRLFAEARERGVPTSLDINFDPEWSGGRAEEIRRRKELVREVLPLVDLAHGNVRELCEFADAPDLLSALGRLTAWGVRDVVVHMGAEGAGYYADGRLVQQPPTPAASVVNSTGTGDVLSICMILLAPRTDLGIGEKLALANRVVAAFMEGNLQLIPGL